MNNQNLLDFCNETTETNYEKLDKKTRLLIYNISKKCLVNKNLEKKISKNSIEKLYKYQKISSKYNYNLSAVVNKYKKNKQKIILTDYIKKNIHVKSLLNLDGVDYELLKNIKKEAINLPFIFDHVGGRGFNSPRRGVCVMGNQSMEENPDTIDTTNWTVSNNDSSVTLKTKTVPMGKYMRKLAFLLIPYLKQKFPDAIISPSTFALFVANHYIADGRKHNISEHTDDQEWYSDPPIFASVTFFPDGMAKSEAANFRFQVRDKTNKKLIKIPLPDSSICMMRADISHKVVPPTATSVKQGFAKSRINLTFRNIVPKKLDPIGYRLGFANHYRYYGIPIEVIFPQNYFKDNKDRKTRMDKVIQRLKKLNPDLLLKVSNFTSQQKSIQKKKLIKIIENKLYPDQKFKKYQEKMVKKTNVVYELLLNI